MNDITELEKLIQEAGFTKETYVACMSDIASKVYHNMDIDWGELKEKYNIQISKDTLRKAASPPLFGGAFVYEYFKSANAIETSNDIQDIIEHYPNETSINKDGSYTSNRLIHITETDLKNKTTLLKAHGFDDREWELVSAKSNLWNAYSKTDGVQELYSSKITVKPRIDISLAEIADFYKELISSYSSPEVKQYNKTKDGKMLVLPIMDLHLGKFSTSDIVGDNAYDSKSARECFNYVIDSVICRLKGENIEKIIFPVGNDFFQYDRADGCTAKGTQQDIDVKYQTLFRDGVTLLIDGITKISKELHTTVEVFYVPGNHDKMSSYHAIMSLWCYFHNNENVIVDTNSSPRHYIEFGRSLIGFTHGDKEKKRISGIMQVEARESWGRTLWHEWLCGHLHSEHVDEESGVIVRHLSSVTGTDAWHHESGFVGAIRKCTCFIWDKYTGLDSIFNVVITDNK